MIEKHRDKESFENSHSGDLGDHVIFIGNKPFMNYVTSVVMQFTTMSASEVVVKARGRFAARAIDVVEVARKRFLEGQIDIAPNGIEIGSEEFTNKEGRKIRVSFIEIKLIRKI